MAVPRRLLLVTSLAAVALPVACGSPSPTLYALRPVAGAARAGGPRVVQLRRIGLARYLDRQQIVRSTEDYRLDVAANDWWGEPLGAMLTRILVEEVSQRLPGTTMLDEDGVITADADLTVEINLRRLDASRTGEVVLAAQVAIAASRRNPRRPPATRSFGTSVPQGSPDLNGFVAAASAAVGRLADAIADMLRA
ncbi:membrane integrity-associated transporter subunit PqiC [Belnapia sp. T6]|uniref:Membrane integrity-associated transporter subunit PqiC n=1 Tax=Belnapia mucosa TaxID=2804532 RepID=A0ABS1VBU8_9PROT|nr:PqiC family protein [Belnapia mucosa]MBL6459145.1 membrane integrity-associated transporter subunit PqiC [Belnapia mucosa]